jgi:hypothetical protein
MSDQSNVTIENSENSQNDVIEKEDVVDPWQVVAGSNAGVNYDKLIGE